MSSSNPDSTASSDDLRGEPRTLKPLSVDPKRGLDFIGDLHGHATRLDELLIRLEYEWIDGIPRHRNRTAIFLGDYVDRGPEIRRTLETVRGMVDRGDAVALMGNHEYNAIAWFTPRP
ncbi:MAG: metallophosphoesterase, partial [Planctomycetota bacterium]|nr:metallophosphoesterase [Planctomycetota bacterium]